MTKELNASPNRPVDDPWLAGLSLCAPWSQRYCGVVNKPIFALYLRFESRVSSGTSPRNQPVWVGCFGLKLDNHDNRFLVGILTTSLRSHHSFPQKAGHSSTTVPTVVGSGRPRRQQQRRNKCSEHVVPRRRRHPLSWPPRRYRQEQDRHGQRHEAGRSDISRYTERARLCGTDPPRAQA